VPWNFDEESVDVLRFFAKLKCRLMPYLYAAAVEATRCGLPVLRAMILEFENDPACEYLDRQYMLGGSLLAAPIFSPDGDVSFYLPSGKWTSFLTGETVQGGAWRHERHGYLSLPFYVRPGSLIALGNLDNRPDYDYASGVELHLFALRDGMQTAATVYGPTGEEELHVTCAQRGNMIAVEATGTGKPWTLVLRGTPSVAAVWGAAYKPRADRVEILPQAGVRRIEIDV
jgi:alpha-D-xyloside xylohydrolase